MSEKTLKQVSNEARNLRAAYADNRITRDQKPYSSHIPHPDAVSSPKPERPVQRFMKYGLGRISVTGVQEFVVRSHYEDKEAAKEPALLGAAANHYHENEAAYHDIAVVEAGMNGVKIDVEHPVEMGQEVPVHAAK